MKADSIFVIAILVAFIVLPGLYFYSHISVCGWKGLFVQCRITDCPK